MLALNWDKKKIKREAKLSERTYWMIKAEYDNLPQNTKDQIKNEASEEEKAKAKFEDYEFVQRWVIRMRDADRVKSWKPRFNQCRRIWLILQKKNPENWTIDDIKLRAIPELRKRCPKTVFHYLIALRSLRPDFKMPDKEGQILSTKREKGKVSVAWRYIYKRIVQGKKLEAFFKAGNDGSKLGLEKELIKRLHVTLGCREGTKGKGGIIHLEWEKVDWKNRTTDVYESKTGGGFYWLGCPLDLFGDRTFEMLKEWYEMNGKPSKGLMFPNLCYGKKVETHEELELRNIYKEAGEAIGEPDIKPHFARKLHASLLKKAKVPAEVVAGKAPHGIVGVGWEDLTTLMKFYVAFADEEIEEAKQKARNLNI